MLDRSIMVSFFLSLFVYGCLGVWIFFLLLFLISRRHFRSYASALLAMYSGPQSSIIKGLGSRIGIIHPEGLHFTRAIRWNRNEAQ